MRPQNTPRPPRAHRRTPNSFHTTAECQRQLSWRASQSQGNTPQRPLQPARPQGTPRYPTPSPRSSANANVARTEAPSGDVTATVTITCDENDLPETNCMHATATVPKTNLKTCPGTLDGKPVTVLLDSGSDSIFFARRLVTPEAFTGKTQRTRCAAGIIPGFPVAAVQFSCTYYKGGPIDVVILEDSPYDVLIGRVTGTANFIDDLPRDLQAPPSPQDIDCLLGAFKTR